MSQITKKKNNNFIFNISIWLSKWLPSPYTPITVGHVCRELSQHNWYEIQERVQFKAAVHNAKARPPLVQGGLKIPIWVKVVWPWVEKLSICIIKVEEIKYLVTGESLDDDEDEELGNTKGEN